MPIEHHDRLLPQFFKVISHAGSGGYLKTEKSGGESGIRTHGRLTPTAVFKSAALNHLALCPWSGFSPAAGRGQVEPGLRK